MLQLNSPSFRAAIHWARTVSQRRAFRLLSALSLHVTLLVVAYSILYTFGLIQHLPTGDRLLKWDAGLFFRLSQTGYDSAASGINAFFPFLPALWRFTGLSTHGISALNGLFGLLGVGILSWAFRLSVRQMLVVLSGPMLFFMLVPYAEALFFLWGAVLLAGLHRQQYGLVLLGLLGACLARSAATLFVPAYLFAELLWWSQHSWPKNLLRIVAGLLTILSAVGIVMLVQYRSHGDALAFYKVHALWQHTFREPVFPLHSTAGINVLWLDAFGLVVALCSLLACAVWGIRWLRSGWAKPGQVATVFPSRAVLFSLGYCVGAGYFIVWYQGGDLVGLARYILSSPFFAVLLWQVWELDARQLRRLLGVVLGVGMVVAAGIGGLWRLNSFYPAQAVGYYCLFLLYLVAYLAVSPKAGPWCREVSAGLYVVNLLFMIYLHQLFAQGVWIN